MNLESASVVSPKSFYPHTIPALTGYVGFAVFLAAFFWLRDDPLGMGRVHAGLFVLMLSAGAMILTELALQAFNPGRYGGYGVGSLRLSALKAALFDKDLLVKLYGQGVILWGLWAIYMSLPLYRMGTYDKLWDLAEPLYPSGLSVVVVYLWVTHAMLSEKRDSLWHFGRKMLFFRAKEAASWSEATDCLFGWCVKAFFLPMMLGFFIDEWNFVSAKPALFHGIETWNVREFYGDAFRSIYFVDLAFAAIGYITSFRLLNTHIRVPEKSFKGWVVCLVCYSPFWMVISQNYILYWDVTKWDNLLDSSPILYTVWGTAILLCLSVYTWATVSFGLRFSNLTHRGIVTHGPYRFVKHPAYICKNLSYWMIELPFIAASPWLAVRNCIMLAMVGGVYYLRAKCEEKVLLVDPLYREYSESKKI